MSLRRALTRAFAVVVFLVLLCGLMAVSGVFLVGKSMDELAGRVQPMRFASLELEAALSDASLGIRGYVLTGEPRFLEAFDRGVQAYPRAIDELHALATPSQRDLIDRQDALAGAWVALYLDVRTPDGALIAPEAITSDRIRAGQDTLDRFGAAHRELTTALTREQVALETRAWRLRLSVLAGMFLLVVAAAGVAVGTGLRIIRAAGGSLAAVAATVERLAAGDESARVSLPMQAPREVEAVAASLNGLAEEAERLRAVRAELGEIRELARIVGLHVRGFLTLDAIADEAATAIGAALQAERVSIRFISADTLDAPAARWSHGRLGPVRPGLSSGGLPAEVTRAYAAGRPIVAPADGALAVLAEEELTDVAGGAVCLLPFGSGEQVMGLLSVVVGNGRVWREGDVDFLEFVAADLGRSVQHARLYADQRQAIDQLQELDQAKSDFLSTVSHELRTPLTSIAGYTELLADEPLEDGQARMLEVIARNALRLQGLIEDLLTLSRMEAGAFVVGYSPVLADDLMSTVAASLPGLTVGRDLEIDLDSGPKGYEILGDIDSLERMLLNLLANAVKFTPDGGRIGLRASVAGGSLCIAVSDTGIGIPDEEQQKLFTRFFRASNATKAAIQGTGLGLAITKSIATHHGGTVHLRSREGAGTTIEVRLPLFRAPGTGMNRRAGTFSDVVTTASAGG